MCFVVYIYLAMCKDLFFNRYIGYLRTDVHLGPYHTEITASRPICEVKHCRAESVVRWGTTREYSGAPGLVLLLIF